MNALLKLRKQMEIDFLKTKTYEEINDMFNQLKEKLTELKKLQEDNVRDSLLLVECEKRERTAFVAGYKYMRERSEEMKKYPFDEAARITANEAYRRWKDNNC